MSLIVADATASCMTDPAFAAHLAPLVAWAKAVWDGWLPRRVLDRLVVAAKTKLRRTSRPWTVASGPAPAMRATATRPGWQVSSATEFVSDLGEVFHLHISSPATFSAAVQAAVRRWQWRKVAGVHPSLAASTAGALFEPLRKLMYGKSMPPAWRAGLRSVLVNGQWPQACLHQAGMVVSPLCAWCQEEAGTEAHRAWRCGGTEAWRRQVVSPVLLGEAQVGIEANQLLWTKALLPHPGPALPPPRSRRGVRLGATT